MKALTIWQPWAELIMHGDKVVETRCWGTKHRGETGIHAAKYKRLEHGVFVPIYEALGYVDECGYEGSFLYYLEHGIGDFGVMLGTAELADCVRIEELYGSVYDNPIERAMGDWSAGRYGWIFAYPNRLKKPVPQAGKQRLWNWEGCI